MEQLIDSYKNSGYLHHAYFLVGNKESIYLKLVQFLEKEVEVKIKNNPDFWSGNFDNLTIEDAREISALSENKSFSSNSSASSGLSTPPTKKIFIIKTETISSEAQNSFLKVFEEPTKDTHFFIISPQDILLPTLRSRMQIILVESEGEKKESIIDLPLDKKLSLVKEITEAISDEEKTKQYAIEFLNQIESELHKKGSEKFFDSLKLCQSTRNSLYDRGAPIKMILENLVLSI